MSLYKLCIKVGWARIGVTASSSSSSSSSLNLSDHVSWAARARAAPPPISSSSDTFKNCHSEFEKKELHLKLTFSESVLTEASPIIIREVLILTLSIFIKWMNFWNRYHIFQHTPCSLGSVLGNTARGTVFRDTLPRMNNRNTSSHGKKCSSNDADRHNVNVRRKVNFQYIS